MFLQYSNNLWLNFLQHPFEPEVRGVYAVDGRLVVVSQLHAGIDEPDVFVRFEDFRAASRLASSKARFFRSKFPLSRTSVWRKINGVVGWLSRMRRTNPSSRSSICWADGFEKVSNRKASARVSAAMRAKNVSSLHCPLAPRLMNPNPRVRPRRAA